MAKPNDTSNPEVTESSPRFVPLLPTSQADMCPRSATLYVDTPGQGPRSRLVGTASPFRRTEARAERTLERLPPETASAGECGAASPPRAPEPSAARAG